MSDGARPGPAGPKKSLFELIGDVPTLVTDLVQREIELVKAEITDKLKALGAGSGLLLGAVITVLFMVGVLLTCAVLALSLVMPGWAAALVVAGGLLLIAIVLALIGYRILKAGMPYYPVESLDSLDKDLRAIKGIGQRGEG